MAIADRIVVMNAGRIEDEGPPAQVYLTPRTLFSAGFMGEVNCIPVTSGQSPLGPLLSGTGTLLIRPEAIGRSGPLPLGPARLIDSAFFGTHQRAHFAPLAAPDLILTAHLPQGMVLEPGTEMHLAATAHVLLAEVP
jgi:spermidine/putrescine transport system ATP-binding protein